MNRYDEYIPVIFFVQKRVVASDHWVATWVSWSLEPAAIFAAISGKVSHGCWFLKP